LRELRKKIDDTEGLRSEKALATGLQQQEWRENCLGKEEEDDSWKYLEAEDLIKVSRLLYQVFVG